MKHYKKSVCTLFSVLAAVIAVSFAACGSAPDENSVNTHDDLLATVQKSDTAPTYDFSSDVTSPESYNTFVSCTTDTALKILAYNTDGNTAISPAATALSLGMIENSVNTETQKAIRTLLGGKTLTVDTVNQSAAYLTQRLKAFNSDTSYIDIANSFWLSSSLTAKRSFLQRNQNFYELPAYKTDFSDSHTSKKITNLVSTLTNGNITDYTARTDESTTMFMMNAAVVSDNWINEFSASSKDTFSAAANTAQETTFLQSTEHYITVEKGTGFVKSLKNTPCRFVALLPNEGVTPEKLIASLNGSEFLNAVTNQDATKFANISIPCFSASYTTDLKETLCNIGAKSLFADNADFSKLCNGSALLKSLPSCCSIILDENGIWGSTAAKGGSQSSSQGENTSSTKQDDSVIFNRPFVYAVVDNESGLPIIAGVINSVS